jgi:hypothetical protein
MEIPDSRQSWPGGWLFRPVIISLILQMSSTEHSVHIDIRLPRTLRSSAELIFFLTSGMDWIILVQDWDQWRAPMKMVMNFRLPQNIGKFLSSWATSGFSRRTHLYGISLLLVLNSDFCCSDILTRLHMFLMYWPHFFHCSSFLLTFLMIWF